MADMLPESRAIVSFAKLAELCQNVDLYYNFWLENDYFYLTVIYDTNLHYDFVRRSLF